jgi:hypothetical protein
MLILLPIPVDRSTNFRLWPALNTYLSSKSPSKCAFAYFARQTIDHRDHPCLLRFSSSPFTACSHERVPTAAGAQKGQNSQAALGIKSDYHGSITLPSRSLMSIWRFARYSAF